MSRLTIQTADTVHPDAKDRLLAAQKNNGFLPNLIGVLANAPTALETYQVVGAINARTGLTAAERSEEHTSELQSLMRISYAVFCLKKKNKRTKLHNSNKKRN